MPEKGCGRQALDRHEQRVFNTIPLQLGSAITDWYFRRKK
jgi:hypothetical protein